MNLSNDQKIFAAHQEDSNNDELVFFSEETPIDKSPHDFSNFNPDSNQKLGGDKLWKILVVDDEEDIHTVTHLTLDDFSFESIPVQILDAFSADQAFDLIKSQPDIAIILLDVVMETTTSGLDLVHRIRNDLNNQFVRIVLRTGQPGYAPERQVVLNYDINDYKSKTELTSDKIFTLVTSGFRAYKSLLQLEEYRRDLQKKVELAVESIRQKDHIIIKQSRQSAISNLISNISHQWRQPLNTVMALIQDLEFMGEAQELSFDYLQKQSAQAMAIIQEMSQTIDDLRFFFQPVEELTDFDTLDVLKRCQKLLQQTLNEEGISLFIEQEPGVMINGYQNDYAQTILQIINNCRDALKDKQNQNKWINIKGEYHSGISRITISDNGGGIDPEIAEHIFEPYFTTRFKSPGRGLSLYMCQIVIEKNMGGKLYTFNNPDGAVFVIEI